MPSTPPCCQVFEAAPSYNSQPGAGVVINYNGARALEAIDPAMLHKWVQQLTYR